MISLSTTLNIGTKMNANLNQNMKAALASLPASYYPAAAYLWPANLGFCVKEQMYI
jgi:hypothetical protein